MPSANSTVSSAQKMPAWKRLGLKLKSAPEITGTDESLPKRKQSPTETERSSKKVKTSTTTPASAATAALSTPTLARKKSVSFTPETKIDDGDSTKQLFNGWIAEQKKQNPAFDFKNTNISKSTEGVDFLENNPKEGEEDRSSQKTRKVKPPKSEKEDSKSPKKSKTKTRSSKTQQKKILPGSARPFLLYLQQYCNSRDTWKFNKNHQNHLIKHAFDLSVIPSNYIHLLYIYVRGLQGGVRTRLRDAALAVKVQDQEAGASVFPKDMDNRDQRQADYEAAIREYIASMTAVEWKDQEIGYEEGMLLGLSDKAMMERTARRMRSEKILKDLEATGTPLVDPKASPEADQSENGAPKKIARKRKQRTMVEEDSSSDPSSSDSSDSSDDESDEPEAAAGNGPKTTKEPASSSDLNSSSDSSASSSEDSDSDSD